MDYYTGIRKSSLKVFIGFLIITAVIAIITVLAGDFGELQLKILATTFMISAASICSMSCAAFIEKRKLASVGLAGIVLSAVGAFLVIAGLWGEVDSERYWKTTVTFLVCSVAAAHAFLLVIPRLDGRHVWVQVVSVASIGILAVQIIAAVWSEIDEENYYRMLTVVAILVGLETLVVPILMKLRKGSGEKAKPLILENIDGEMYRDSAGKIYKVTEIPAEKSDSAG